MARPMIGATETDVYLVAQLVGGERQRVGAQHPLDRRVLDAVDRRPREQTVRAGGDDSFRAALLQQFGRRNDGAAGVDHVVDEHAGAALDIADDLFGFDDVFGSLRRAL